MATHTTTTARPEQAPPGPDRNATRYLCAGAEVDADFADAVIHEVLEQRYRAIAPSWGLQLVPVVGHALAGRRRRNLRNAALAVIALVNLLLDPVGTVLMAVTWLWIRGVYRVTRQVFPRSHVRYAVLVATASVLFLLPLLVLVALVLYGVLTALSPLTAETSLALGPLGPFALALARRLAVVVLLPSLLATWAVLLAEQLAERSLLLRLLGRGRQPALPPHLHYGPGVLERFQAIQHAEQQSNVTVFSGYSPFLGAGRPVHRWSFTLDLARRATAHADAQVQPTRRAAVDGQAEQAEPARLTVSELHRRVAERLTRLAGSGGPDGRHLQGLELGERLFVTGTSVARDARFLPRPDRPPVSWVPPAVVEELREHPTGSGRHFTCVRVESWGREVALSVFLHLAIQGATLYVEETACVLLPIRAHYHLVDRLTRRLLPGELGHLLWLTAKDIPASLLRAPVALLGAWRTVRALARGDAVVRAMLDEGTPIDYGARMSVRERAADPDWGNDFQDLDVNRQLQLIELHLLEAILDLLAERGVDISTFRRDQLPAIINAMVVKAGTITGGAFAKASG